MPESITKKIKINNLSIIAASPPPNEYVVMNFVIVIGTPQAQPKVQPSMQFSGNLVIEKAEFKRLNATVGDELTITIALEEKTETT
jgi:hypothetical protein